MKNTLLALAGLALSAGAASAEVTGRTADGFTLSHERRISASAEAVFAAIGRPGDWWSDAHTWSGSAANISVDLGPGGCWCEALEGGGVKHAEAVLVWPARRMVRFEAPFGPLQGMTTNALLTMTWADAPDGGRLLKWSFVVSGPGTGALADPVDAVLGEQFNRLAGHLQSD